MKFLIFGGSGFIGKTLAADLKNRNAEVAIVSRSGGAEGFAVDISNAADFEQINFIPDVIINCASRVPQKKKTSQDPDFVQELFSTNALGGLNIANWAVSRKVPKLINCSTLVVVKKPWPVPLKENDSEIPEGSHVAYSMSKLSQEKLMTEAVKNTNTELLHARLSAVYGRYMVPEGILFQLMRKLISNEEVKLADSRKNSIDLIHVKDVSKALYELALAKTSDEKVINIANGSSVSIYGLAEKLKKISNSNSRISDTESSKKNSEAVISVEKLQTYTGLDSEHFISLDEGLEELVSDYKKSMRSGSL